MTRARRAPRTQTSLSLREFHALFPDEAAARAWFEAARWPDGPVCPRCGATERASWLASRSRWTCRDCKLQYSVMSFTPMHRSHIPLLVWAQAIYLMVTSSKGISALKLSEILGLSYRSAWLLTKRIQVVLDADAQSGSPLLNGLIAINEAAGGTERPVRDGVDSQPRPGNREVPA